MKRYFTARYSEELGEEVHDNTHAYTIFEPDDEPYDTGLIDKRGLPILAQSKINQIGFIRRD